MSKLVICSALGFSGILMGLVAQGCDSTTNNSTNPGNGSDDSGAPGSDSSTPLADGSPSATDSATDGSPTPTGDGGSTCGVAATLSGAACILPATITSSMTLTSACQPWHIAAAGTVVADPSSPVLTIDPCVTIEVDTGGSLTVAGANPAGLVAVGTATQPITFTSSSAAPVAGNWGNVAIANQAIYPTTTLQYVNIMYAGGAAGSAATTGALAVSDTLGGTIVLKDLTISHNANFGIHMAGTVGTTGIGFGTGSGNFTITDWGTGLSPIALDIGDEAATVPATLTLGASGHEGQVELTGSNSVVDVSGTWASLPVPYLLDGNLSIAGTVATAATLTIAAPNVIQSKANAVISIAAQGNLVANGTAGNLVFTTNATAPSPAAWGGILFNVPAAGLSGSSLTGCTIDSAGSASSSSSCLDAAVVVVCTDAVTVAGPAISGNIIKNYPTTESGLASCVLSNAASYSNNTFADLGDGGLAVGADGGSSAVCSY